VHYAAIRQPQDPQAFIADLKRRMTDGLDRLSAGFADGSAGGARVTTRHGDPWITVPKLDEPTGLTALKEEVVRRWGVLDLLDVLKNADFLTGFTDEFSSVAARTHRLRRPPAPPAAGAVRTGHEHGHPRHLRRVGPGTACASDSKKFGSWSSNFMTEYHARYGGNGVMIYWHVERKNVCIYSQLKSCSSSEVAAMIDGLLRRFTRGGPSTPRTRPRRTRPRCPHDLRVRLPLAPAPVESRAHQHSAAPAGSCRTGLGEEAVGRGPVGPDRLVLVERQPVRHLPPRHGQTARPVARGRARTPSGGRRHNTAVALNVMTAWFEAASLYDDLPGR
jgi:hypothetical protein